MALEVIGAGFGRTGTMSLKAALEKLGAARCYHMVDVFQTPEHVPLWKEAAMLKAAGEAERIDWATLLEGFRSTADWPGCTFYRELMARFPDAKVLLSVRDPERWYESVDETTYKLIRHRVPNPQPWRELHEILIWQGTFDGRFEERDHAIAVFERHNAEVRAHVPAERLLEYTVGEGWEPLCAFLDVTVPEEPFPHLNDRAAFAEIAKRLG